MDYRALTATGLAIVLLGTAVGCGDSDDPETDRSSADKAQPADTSAAGGTKDGGSEDGGGGAASDGGSSAADSVPGNPALTGDRQQARQGAEAIVDVYGGIDEAVAAGVATPNVNIGDTLEAADESESLTAICDLMSKAARRETVIYGKRSAGLAGIDWSCERAMGLLLRRTKQSGKLGATQKAQVIGVNAEGDRATATIRFGGPNARASTVSLVREDGKWKLAGTPGR
jgi:hypothetical protein